MFSGVELSVNDGANGIHCLLVFDFEKWCINGEDFINQYLDQAADLLFLMNGGELDDIKKQLKKLTEN